MSFRLGEDLKDKMPARVRPPGEFTAYSNYGSALAAYIVEQVSGMPFDKYVDEEILLPLNMNSSSFQQPLPPRLASNMSNGLPLLKQCLHCGALRVRTGLAGRLV